MKQLLQRRFLSGAVTWQLRALHGQSGRVTNRILAEDLGHGTSAKLVSKTAAGFTKSCPLSFTVPLLFQKPDFSIPSRCNIGRLVNDGNPRYKIILPEIPEKRIQELIFPYHSRITSTIIGDLDSGELTIGDCSQNATTLHCKRFKNILKIRRKKIKKHKLRKRQKRDLFKRRHIKVLREKKKARRQEEERKAKLEKARDEEIV